MARARNIKPGFFLNQDLVELPFSTRLLFIGLWTIADRDGRMSDKPKQIKMSLFPADDINVDAALQELADAKFIIRYVVKNERFIEVVNFQKHQNPHVKEVASTIPAPCKHRASTRQARLIPDSLLPLTDSPLLNDEKEKRCVSSETPKPKPDKRKGTRLPDPFLLTSEMRTYGQAKRPDVDLTLETEKFCNYFRAAPGQKGVKLDWGLTWKNWILNAKESGNGKRSEREKSAERGSNALAFIDELRRQGAEEQALSRRINGSDTANHLALKPAESH